MIFNTFRAISMQANDTLNLADDSSMQADDTFS